MIIITDESCTRYRTWGHPERPERISRTRALLESQKELPLTWETPLPVADPTLLLAHTPKLLERLETPHDFDADTSAHPGIGILARNSVGAALRSLEHARNGRPSFSLMRPPGHHAEADRAMGFCYLNSMAITALEAQRTGFKRVAVYDFDVHHGNGTEDILLDRPNLAFFSIHQFPCYPGSGGSHRGENCKNYPVLPYTPREAYREKLSTALQDLKEWKPDLIGISAGFDAYHKDPLAQGTLHQEDFYWLGESIKKLSIPSYAILEGGYSQDLPELIFAFLKGLDSSFPV